MGTSSTSFKSGSHHPRWQGGVRVVHNGTDYLRISAGPLKGKYVHQIVMEAKLGRPLSPGEEVEHCDGDGLNCAPDNLIIVTHPENMRLMHKRRKRNKQSRATDFNPEEFVQYDQG